MLKPKLICLNTEDAWQGEALQDRSAIVMGALAATLAPISTTKVGFHRSNSCGRQHCKEQGMIGLCRAPSYRDKGISK